MKAYIVGIGMDGRKTLTCEAEKIISESHILIGAKRMLEPFQHMEKELFCTYKTNEIVRIIHENSDKRIAVLMSGDCGFFSGAKKLFERLVGDIEIICGISSPVYFCSKIGLSWEKMKLVSLHGNDAEIAVNVKLNRYCFFLLGGEVTPSDICKRLCRYGLSDTEIYIGENLGMENEKITKGTAKELESCVADKLCVLIAENSDYIGYTPSGIPDDEFIRESVPMTKSEVRSLVVSKLNICFSDICVDCGCGTGSVSVEMAYRCPDGKVYGFDVNSDAVELTKKNSFKFGCDNISARLGDSAEILKSHSEIIPDKAFIGGTKGGMNGLVKLLFARNPKIKLVITAVTLETLSNALAVLDELGADTNVSQISVVRTKKVGNSTMLDAQNPVFIIEGELKCEE